MIYCVSNQIPQYYSNRSHPYSGCCSHVWIHSECKKRFCCSATQSHVFYLAGTRAAKWLSFYSLPLMLSFWFSCVPIITCLCRRCQTHYCASSLHKPKHCTGRKMEKGSSLNVLHRRDRVSTVCSCHSLEHRLYCKSSFSQRKEIFTVKSVRFKQKESVVSNCVMKTPDVQLFCLTAGSYVSFYWGSALQFDLISTSNGPEMK